MTDSKRELIKELKKHHWSSDGTVGYDWSDEIASFILAREQAMLNEIEKPLRNQKKFKQDIGNFGNNSSDDAIDETLATIARMRGKE